MRRLLPVLFGLALMNFLSSPVLAQEKAEVFIGFSYLSTPVSVVGQPIYCPVQNQCSVPATIFTDRTGLKGVEISADHPFGRYFRVVGDVSGHYGPATSDFPTNARTHQYMFLGGLQFARPSRLSPFAHILAGATHQSATYTGNSFFITFPDTKTGLAIAAGGGIDLRMNPKFSFRLIQADYISTRLGGSTQSVPRISLGFQFRF